MIITYEVGDALYLNITNRCSNRCIFCIRENPNGMQGLDLWLEWEPTIEEVLGNLAQREMSKYKEVVFCGFGEPLMRFSDVIKISRQIKALYLLPIRINTNGQGSLIAGRDITGELQGLIDAVSISLNAKSAVKYQAVCQSVYGEAAFAAVLDFAAKAKKYVPKVVLSVVEIMPAEDIEECQTISRKIGVQFRVRKFVE
jgi:TatD family-associated radical SAM protein